jgi:uracil-DNA glycosylase
MIAPIASHWEAILQTEFKQDYFQQLTGFVEKEYQTETIYPPQNQIFEAFNTCPFENTKVIILGQDPYHNEQQAHGLAFSVNPGVKNPPSLNNIFKELASDLGVSTPSNGCLLRWAKQGVLLLNTVLTVRAHQPKSHRKQGWEKFTDAVIRMLSDKKQNLVFVLWGGDAHKKEKYIDTSKHLVLKSAHPSPLSVYRGFWGCQHFSQINDYLLVRGKTPIAW